ncbi:AAA family ATPase [Asticcacaulis excentricus]|uniref:ATPase AAA-type core domain-containing protein n=1 Tax=Asticcacaulis excentricus TaxID=78587 RepID=A0A3G9G7U9_9CAUL|nr:AAA family ATPase [Asticcacaulis excentricus]BBF81263.1 hypothetical protein EM6_1860 [Asticcacaulis excentricus]
MPNLNELVSDSASIRNLSNLNVIVGRNGAGKSRFVRDLVQTFRNNSSYNIKYVSPERGGSFKRDATVETNMAANPSWLSNVRHRNQDNNFKSASAHLFNQLETAFLRKMETDSEIRGDFSKTFVTVHLDKINGLLTNIVIERSTKPGTLFEFKNYDGTASIEPENISSGESEAVALATEIMFFFATLDAVKENILFLDEPDVHQHPDLQARMANFIIDQFASIPPERLANTYVVVATHSSPLICDLSSSPLTTIGTKYFGNTEITQRAVDDSLRKAAPFFAHPLSKSLSDDPILIVEGEDDEQIWRQASRSSQGRIKLFACLAGSVAQQTELERFTNRMLTAIYDDPVGFSVRDGDGSTEALVDEGCVKRFRLGCYAIENLLLTDECLQRLDSSWEDFQAKATTWLAGNSTHKDRELVEQLIASEDRLRHVKIKNIRQLICAILNKDKPWEVPVGQTLGSIIPDYEADPLPFSITSFVGLDLMKALNF